jgi:hypothetical protein
VKRENEQDSTGRSLKPLLVPVRTAANLLGVGPTTAWNLIGTGKVTVVRIGRRTLVTMASLEALVAMLASPSLEPEALVESRDEGVEKMPRILMTLEQARSATIAAGFSIFRERRLPNEAGTQLVTTTGQVVDVYDKGTLHVHGHDPARLRTALSQYRTDPKAPGQ